MAIIASTPENDAAVLATLPYLLLTIAFTFLAVVRKSVSLSLMEGLTCYILPETDEERWRARIAKATHEKKSSESKRRAKGARAPPAGNIDELGENSIAAIAMTKNQLILKPFWSHVDRLVFFACLVIVHCVAREVHAFVVASDGGAGSDAEGTTTTTTTNVLLAPLAAFSAVSAMRALVRAAIDPASTPAVERHVAVAAGFIGFAFSLVFLLSSPAFARAFEVAETARLTAGATLAETRAFGMEIVTLAEMQVCVALSALAGFINAALFAPAVRVARCYKTRVDAPSWDEGRGFVGASVARATCLRVAITIPFVAMIAWFDPLMRDPLGLSESALATAKAASLVVAGAALLLATPSLTQGFLDGAIITWYEVQHDGIALDASAALASRNAVRQKLMVTNRLACKVATQAAAPAALFVSCGALLLAEGDGAGFSVLNRIAPAVAWRTIASYVGWWSCASWAFTTCASIAGHNVGAGALV